MSLHVTSHLHQVGALSLMALGIQGVFGVFSAAQRSEKLFDISATATFVACGGASLYMNRPIHPRQFLVTGMLAIWTLRLGSFLYKRIQNSGKDPRFDGIRESPMKMLAAFGIQALWVSVLSYPAWITNATSLLAPSSSAIGLGLGLGDIAGLGVYAMGLLYESIADRQKSEFRESGGNNEPPKFMCSGLWARSRHPNYFGEMVLWYGQAITAVWGLTSLQGTYPIWFVLSPLIAPIFNSILLRFVSGVPMTEDKMNNHEDEQVRKWFKNYAAKTNCLIPGRKTSIEEILKDD